MREAKKWEMLTPEDYGYIRVRYVGLDLDRDIVFVNLPNGYTTGFNRGDILMEEVNEETSV